MYRILCYGDSNTWGFISGTDHQRYNENERWTKLLQKNLGINYEVIEEGLNSRTIMSEDDRPGKEGKNGYKYLKPCLETHDKLDLIVLMLGTNDLKNTFNNSVEDIGNMLDTFTDFILNYKSQIDKSISKLLILGLPPVNEFLNPYNQDDKYVGTSEKCKKVNKLYEKMAKSKNLIYVNNDELKTGPDGVHITKESHFILANKLTKIIKEMF